MQGGELLMCVSPYIAAALGLVQSRHRDVWQRWVTVSHKIGGHLPESLLVVSVQHMGKLDMLLRCMEDERRCFRDDGVDLNLCDFQVILSQAWVGGVYEIVRLLDDQSRKLESGAEGLKALHHDLRLIRVPLEKHELAGDRKLKDPLTMQRRPPRDNASDTYVYDMNNPRRAHIMPAGVSENGSVKWEATDVEASVSNWLERRSLADRFLELWDARSTDQPPSPTG